MNIKKIAFMLISSAVAGMVGESLERGLNSLWGETENTDDQQNTETTETPEEENP